MSSSDAMNVRRRVRRLADRVSPAAAADPCQVEARLQGLAKPPGSLGELETLAVRLAGIHGDPPPPLKRRVVLVFAGDHGVTGQGVSAHPPTITGQMAELIASGRAGVNAAARAGGARVRVVDVGVDGSAGALADVTDAKVRLGTGDLAEGPALRMEEVAEALEAGFRIAAEEAERADVLAVGEMGIGNTTPAAAVTAALTGASAEAVVGPGAGARSAGLDGKREVVARAVARLPSDPDPVGVLAEVGGLEIAAVAGAALGGAASGRPVVTDGAVATAGVLAAVRMAPPVRGYLVASHRSPEPAHALQLEALGLRPLLDLGLRLGEGSGAALALPLLEAAGDLLRGMATLEDLGVEAGTPEGPPGGAP